MKKGLAEGFVKNLNNNNLDDGMKDFLIGAFEHSKVPLRKKASRYEIPEDDAYYDASDNPNDLTALNTVSKEEGGFIQKLLGYVMVMKKEGIKDRHEVQDLLQQRYGIVAKPSQVAQALHKLR